MYKKSLIATAAAAALVPFSASAVDLDNITRDWTREGAELAEDFAAPPVTITLEAEYTVGDLITLTFSHDVVGGFPSTVNFEETGYTLTWGLISEDAASAVYRVTELTADDVDDLSTLGADFTLRPESGDAYFTVDGDTLRDSESLTLSYASETAVSNIPLESGATDNMFTFEDQYGSATAGDGFSKTIDVEPGVGIVTRSVFDDATSTDTTEVTVASLGATATYQARTTGIIVTLTGDLSFADVSSLSGTLGTQTATVALASDGSAATFDFGNFADEAAFGDVVISFDNAANSDAQMIRGSFTTSVDVQYVPITGNQNTAVGWASSDETSVNIADGLDAGAWDIDGSSIQVYAVPVSDNVAPFIWVTNRASGDAPVRIVATTESGVMADLGMVAIAEGNTITRVSSQITDALAEAGITSGRVTLNVTTSAPACDVNISASYKVLSDADRLPLETSQTLQGSHNTGNSGAADDLCVL